MENKTKQENNSTEPQCHFFVVRKKRLCRMTVRPGRQYCGEHEPHPKTIDNLDDKRIPCPNDPKHTCYISKLEKHLSICNARPVGPPPYIVRNINAPDAVDPYPRKLLSQIPLEILMEVVDKVNLLYDEYIKDHLTLAPEHAIHSTILEEFNEPDRTETSLRHLRQASSLLWLIENEQLVSNRTCYVELGAGKGQLSYYACCAWGGESTDSRVLLVDRASLRHKRDNKLSDKSTLRIRADLAHLALERVPAVAECTSVVGFAKHLCGVATDYALRCITADGVVDKTKGIVLATCCHHRCDHAGYVASTQLRELGITNEYLNAMLGIVSWATCGYGCSREVRKRHDAEQRNQPTAKDHGDCNNSTGSHNNLTESEVISSGSKDHVTESGPNDLNGQNNYLSNGKETTLPSAIENDNISSFKAKLTKEYKEQVGKKAKVLFDWGRVLYLREQGFDAKLLYYVPTNVSLENICIVATKLD